MILLVGCVLLNFWSEVVYLIYILVGVVCKCTYTLGPEVACKYMFRTISSV